MECTIDWKKLLDGCADLNGGLVREGNEVGGEEKEFIGVQWIKNILCQFSTMIVLLCTIIVNVKLGSTH